MHDFGSPPVKRCKGQHHKDQPRLFVHQSVNKVRRRNIIRRWLCCHADNSTSGSPPLAVPTGGLGAGNQLENGSASENKEPENNAGALGGPGPGQALKGGKQQLTGGQKQPTVSLSPKS
uniref:Uncharacterized protein n=1 Tax=Eutreptiella gymnastica TaxID=73025 RepID=A0A7S1J2P2_9EUGL